MRFDPVSPHLSHTLPSGEIRSPSRSKFEVSTPHIVYAALGGFVVLVSDLVNLGTPMTSYLRSLACFRFSSVKRYAPLLLALSLFVLKLVRSCILERPYGLSYSVSS